MIKFKNRIVQLGFGAVGKSFFEKLPLEIDFNIDDYFVISVAPVEVNDFVKLGGKLENFIVNKISRDNYVEIFESYLREGDLLIDFVDSVGTTDFINWCARHNVMYLNTGETDWEGVWYNILNENIEKCKLRDSIDKENISLPNSEKINKYPIVIHHGNNPGLVSHFVRAGLEYIIREQFSNNEKYKELIKNNKFNELAYELGLKQIHVNDIDTQILKKKYEPNVLFNTWSIDSFFFEMISNATASIGTSESDALKDMCKNYDKEHGFVEFKNIALDVVGKTYYPFGKFEGYLVPHEETVSIAKSLEVNIDGECIYRPTVVFLYSPCEYAREYMKKSRVLFEYEDIEQEEMEEEKIQPKSTEFVVGKTYRGFTYPYIGKIVYPELLKKGTEYVGVLLLGTSFSPVWVGNKINNWRLNKFKRRSYWQTPTITPVAMSALSACVWMIKNKDRGGIYFPEDIEEYNEVISFAEKYITKTVYKTFEKNNLEQELQIKLNDIKLNDIIKFRDK